MPNLIYRKAENELWINQEYLLQLLPGLTETYLRVKARPQYKASVQPCFRNKTFLPVTDRSWRWGKINNEFYMEYDSIPCKAPTFYKDHLPQRAELIASIKENNQQQQQTDLQTFLNPYLNEYYKVYLPVYADCTRDQQINLSKAASLVKGAVDYVTQNNISFHKNDFFIAFCQYLAESDVKYIPHNCRAFKRRFECAFSGGSTEPHTPNITELITVPRSGNNNALKHSNDAELESWIFQMRNDAKNFTGAHIERKIQFFCNITNKPMPSQRWIGSVMEKANTRWLTAAERFGDKGRQGQMYRGYIPTANAMYAGDCWQVDGTRVNFLDFKLNGKNVFLYIVAVRDVHSGDVLGYSFDLSENRWSVSNALKMAVDEAGYLPYQLVFDRFPGHNTREIKSFIEDLENRGVKVTITHTATGKAHIERWFSTMQQVFMQDSNYYYGEGIQSRNAFAHRSKDELLRMKKAANADGWNFDSSVNEACKLIEAYRSTKLSYYSRKFKSIENSPAELHAQSEKPNVITVEPHQIVYLFGLSKLVTPKNQGLIVTDINTVTFHYRLQNIETISRYTGKKIMMCYTLENLDEVQLYELSDRPLKKYLGCATEEVLPQVYGPNPEYARIEKRKALVFSIEQERKRQLNMKMAAGSEVTMMLTGAVAKHEVEEEETAWLNQEFSNTDDVNSYDVTDQY